MGAAATGTAAAGRTRAQKAATSSSDNSIVQQWVDPNSGFAITSASESGNTVTITTLGNPNWVSGVTQVEVDGVAFSKPSDAASAIAGKRTGGWWFFLTDQASQRSLRSVRRDYVHAMAVDAGDDEPDDEEDEDEG